METRIEENAKKTQAKGTKNKEPKSKVTPPNSEKRRSTENSKNGSKYNNTTDIGSQTENMRSNQSFESDKLFDDIMSLSVQSNHSKNKYVINDDENVSAQESDVAEESQESQDLESTFAFTPIKTTQRRRTSQINLSQAFSQLLMTQKNSDLNLYVDGYKFRAHRAILHVRCPAIMQMLSEDEENNREEDEKNDIVLNDIDVEVFKEFLRFVYTGKTQSMENIAPDLLKAAHRFKVEDLHKSCVKYLSSNLSAENVIDILCLSVKSNSKKLRTNAIKYLGNNLNEVIERNWDKCFRIQLDVKHLIYALLPQKG